MICEVCVCGGVWKPIERMFVRHSKCVCGHTPIPEFRIGWNYSDFGWLRTGGQVLANATAAYMDKADIVMHIVNIYILRQYSGIAHCVEILSRELFIH